MSANDLQGELALRTEYDIIIARKKIRKISESLMCTLTEITRIVTAASELARNVVQYAGNGIIRWEVINADSKLGIEMSFIDNGPGISNIEQATRGGYSTSGGLGLGLSGVKRIMDEIEIQSEVGKGTTVTIRKWMKQSKPINNE